MALTINLQPGLEAKIKYLISKQTSVEGFFSDLVNYKISELKKAIFNIEKDLRRFEKKYNQNSSDFFKQFEEGKLGDEDDFMVWAGLYEMYQRNIAELNKIK
jgi:hypothetical protein